MIPLTHHDYSEGDQWVVIKFTQICVHRTQEIYPYPHGHMASFQACLVQGSGAEPGIFSAAFENGGYLDFSWPVQ